jgi:hypothetical protein
MPKLYHLLLWIAATIAAPALPQDAEVRVPVTFTAGAMQRSFEGAISDFEVMTYVVALRQGESLRIQLASNNASNCFDIHGPESAKPIYLGAESGSTHVHKVQKSGEYLVKVFLLRLAARDGQTAQYALELERIP